MRLALFLGFLALGSALLGPYLTGLRDKDADNPDWWLALGITGFLFIIFGFI